MWLQIPFFCGHSANCWKPGNKWALTEAKKNLVNNYLLVGVTEELNDFIDILEHTLPSIFIGASYHYLHSNKSHLRRTIQKEQPSELTVKKIQESTVWQMENELYEFALEQFHFIKKQSRKKIQNLMYEKIKPKNFWYNYVLIDDFLTRYIIFLNLLRPFIFIILSYFV